MPTCHHVDVIGDTLVATQFDPHSEKDVNITLKLTYLFISEVILFLKHNNCLSIKGYAYLPLVIHGFFGDA